ncbi:MAG: secretin N-terminal domain-containing protein [Chthoniobacter sp.]|uniref:secretin N-terminal domain-containing protein n=1 Tax=Chthoniobacter sp. TaxID=2510640 RepID=UPI0032A7089F
MPGRVFILSLFFAFCSLSQSRAQFPAGNANPAPPPAATNGSVRLQFPNTDVREVLGFYELLTGKRIVVDNQVSGTVNIVVTGDIPKEEAIRIIEINLLLNGITLIPVENSDIVKVVGTGKNPRGAAIPIISDELLIPAGEQVVTFVTKLHYADPTELQQTLTGFIGQSPGGYTNITALPKAQALLITENSATIRGLVHILHEIDVPPAEVISEFIALERADASDVLEKLKAIFEKQPANGSAPGALPVKRTTPAGTALPANTVVESTGDRTVEIRATSLSEDSIIVGKIKLTADVRTNRIHVVTRQMNMVFVRKLIGEFDSTAKFGEPVSRPLRFVPVADVLDVVVKAITDPGMKEESSSSPSAKPAQNTNNSADNNRNGNGSGNNGSGGSGTDFNVSEGLSTQPVDTTPEARVIGTTKIIADKNANAIIVIGGEDVKAKVFRLLDQLDQRIPQVMLHTTIGELDLDDKHQFGVDYILRSSGLGLSPIQLNTGTAATGTTAAGTSTTGAASGTTTNTTGAATTASGTSTNLVSFNGNQPVLNPGNLLTQGLPRVVAAVGGSGLTGYFTAGNSMSAIVTALENTSRFRVVSRPTVIARNNKKAIIASGQEIAVPTSIQSALNSTNNSNGIVSNSSVQFKRVALQLEMVPLINSEREVSLDILQKIDEVSGSTRIDNNDIPTISTRYVKTSVTVPNESTLVLGGLIKQSQNRVKSGVPVLSNIPLLGYLFSNTTKEKLRTELIILVRPEVSWTPPEARQLRQRAEEFLNLEPNLEASLFPPNRVLSAPAVPFRTGNTATPAAKPASKSPANR